VQPGEGEPPEDVLERAIRLTGAGVWELDRESVVTFINPAAATLGYHQGEIVGRNALGLLDATNAAASRWYIERRRSGGINVREVRLRHRDGRDVRVLLAAATLLDERGEFAGTTAVTIDISERWAAESAAAALAATVSRREGADGAAGRPGRWVLNLDNGRLSWSRETFVLFGRNPHSYTPAYPSVLDLIHEADRRQVDRMIEASVVDRKPFSTYLRAVLVDGTTRVLYARGEVSGDTGTAVIAGEVHATAIRERLRSAISPREREVLDLVAQGLTNDEIAVRLQLSPTTIRTHIQHAVKRLGAHNRVHAVVLALRGGEIEL
jgi:PAS domain S-box-containing protein